MHIYSAGSEGKTKLGIFFVMKKANILVLLASLDIIVLPNDLP